MQSTANNTIIIKQYNNYRICPPEWNSYQLKCGRLYFLNSIYSISLVSTESNITQSESGRGIVIKIAVGIGVETKMDYWILCDALSERVRRVTNTSVTCKLKKWKWFVPTHSNRAFYLNVTNRKARENMQLNAIASKIICINCIFICIRYVNDIFIAEAVDRYDANYQRLGA